MTTHTGLKALAALLGAVLAAPLFAATQAGSVVLLTGQATALSSDGTVRRLAKSDPVYAGDLVISGIGSYVNLKFADGAFFLLRPETRFQIEAFDYPAPAATAAAAPATPAAPTAAARPDETSAPPLVTAPAAAPPGSRAFFRLVKGGFRSVSGLIGKLNREDYRVSTPVATIGIRGTSYSARLCEGACEDREEIHTGLRAAGKSVDDDATVLVTTVDDGAISLETSAGEQIQGACQNGVNCGALLTAPDGSVVELPQRPAAETKERNLDPAACT